MRAFSGADPLLSGRYWVEDSGACSGAYVLEEGRTLIDTGNMYGLVDALSDLGSTDRLQRIFLTHAHFDHVGGLAEIFQAANPDVYVHPFTREYLRLLRPPFPEFFDALEGAGKLKTLGDGDWTETDPPLRVLHTPGHTAGDLCFFDERSKSLYSGDAVLSHKARFGAILSKPDEVCGGRMEDKIRSLKRLLGLPVRHLFPGHGEPVLERGADIVKIALMTLFQSLHEERPEEAWRLMAEAFLEADQPEEAWPCVQKARELAPRSEQVRAMEERVRNRLGR